MKKEEIDAAINELAKRNTIGFFERIKPFFPHGTAFTFVALHKETGAHMIISSTDDAAGAAKLILEKKDEFDALEVDLETQKERPN